MKRTTIGTTALLFSSLTACAATQPSAQLLDARDTMATADASHAKDQAPSGLLDAHNLLERAEQEKDGSDEEIQLAYLAERTAQKAQSHGNSLYFAMQREQTDARYHQLQKTGRLDAEERLDATQEELGATQDEMARQRSSSRSALASSEEGRRAAEARAASAIASLNSLANVKEEANRTVITLSGSVLFKTGESTLLPLAQDTFTRVANALKELSSHQKVVIEGHTDSRGDDESNQQLSQARAQAVMSFLVAQGVEANTMSAVGKGETRPIASNDTPEGRANNRRVELLIEK